MIIERVRAVWRTWLDAGRARAQFWRQQRADHERALLDAITKLHRTKPDPKIRVPARHHLRGGPQPRRIVRHGVWRERDRAWWQPRWCWWLGCGPVHGYRWTHRGAVAAMERRLAGHRCEAATS